MSARRSTVRGNVALLFAITLPILLGFVALVVDLGHMWVVRNELQNAADSAALAAARELNGTVDAFLPARLAAQDFAQRHTANRTDVDLDLNVTNAANGNIVMGNWDFNLRQFNAASAVTPAYLVNAVQVTARRTAAEGGAVTTWFAKLMGRDTMETGVTAVAVGGTPGEQCAAPLAVSDCSVIQADGNVRCNAVLTFGDATQDNAGFTLLNQSNPTTPTVTCLMARTLQQPCPNNCDCSQSCNQVSSPDGTIQISNGNNLSQKTVNDINNSVLAAGGNPVYITIPVVASGLTPGNCASFNYNQNRAVVGYVTLRLLGASGPPTKQIRAAIDCTQTDHRPPAGAFFGYRSTTVYLTR